MNRLGPERMGEFLKDLLPPKERLATLVAVSVQTLDDLTADHCAPSYRRVIGTILERMFPLQNSFTQTADWNLDQQRKLIDVVLDRMFRLVSRPPAPDDPPDFPPNVQQWHTFVRDGEKVVARFDDMQGDELEQAVEEFKNLAEESAAFADKLGRLRDQHRDG